jgi:hypothetical protein
LATSTATAIRTSPASAPPTSTTDTGGSPRFPFRASTSRAPAAYSST